MFLNLKMRGNPQPLFNLALWEMFESEQGLTFTVVDYCLCNPALWLRNTRLMCDSLRRHRNKKSVEAKDEQTGSGAGGRKPCKRRLKPPFQVNVKTFSVVELP